MAEFRWTTITPATLRTLSLLAALLLVLLPGVVDAGTVVDLDTDGPIAGGDIGYLAGDPAVGGPDAIAASVESLPWRPLPQQTASFGFDRRPYWFRLDLANPGSERRQRYLQIGYPLLDHVDVYVVSDGQVRRHWRLGDEVPFGGRPIAARSFTVPIDIPPGARLSVLLRVHTSSALQVPLALYRGGALAAATQTRAVLLGMYYGAIAVIFCYNLMAFAAIRERSHLYYLFYVTAIALSFLSINGLGYQYLWPFAAGISKQVLIAGLAAATLFALLFTRRFLDLEQGGALAGSLRILSRVLAVATAAVLVVPYRYAIEPLLALLTLAIGLTTVAGIVRWRQGDGAGMLFTVAWAVLLGGGLVMTAEKFGLILRTPITENMAQVGSAIDVLLLSLALVSRLRDERRQRDHARVQALEYEHLATLSRRHALQLQQRVADDLEVRVRERTEELERLNQKLRRLSTTDPLTRVHNRRFFDERLRYEFSRARRERQPVALLVIDIDFFKRVNDTYGHAAGDQMLREIAAEIAAEARRETDVIARFGGEEFAAMLPATTAAQAAEIAERIRARVAGRGYSIVGDEGATHNLQASVSIGVAATIPGPTTGPDDLLKRADSALYRAKDQGRNRVMLYREPPLLTEPLAP